MTSLKLALALLGAAGLVGIGVGYFLRYIISLGKRGSVELQIRQMMLDAEEKAKRVVEEAEKRAETKSREISGEFKENERELKQVEERLIRKEDLLDKRQANLDQEQETLGKKADDLVRAREEADRIVAEQNVRLERIAGLS